MQATHFVDLMRYLGGEIVQESIKAVAVGPALPLSDMAKAPQAEHEVHFPPIWQAVCVVTGCSCLIFPQ